jgi:hypothetical protein
MWWNVSERSISSLQHPETNERATANVPPACLKCNVFRETSPFKAAVSQGLCYV